MTTSTLTHRAGTFAALALTLTMGLSACGSNDTSTTSANKPADSMSQPASADGGTFGPGCKLIPAAGAGSFNGMATAPVASAASANPLLKTLVAAVTKAGLVDTLNSADALTVLAPTDDAFAKIPKADLDKVLANKKELTTLLTHHVIAGKLTPKELVGTHKTLAGDNVTISGSGDALEVAGYAKVLCGNIQTANATVYVIDSVLTH